MELAVTILLSFKPDKAILVNIIPTPAIIALIIVEPAKLTIVDRVPVSPNITIAKPENNIIESLSLIFFPNIPARAIVSAWNEIGITEPYNKQATAPTIKPKAVGIEANP